MLHTSDVCRRAFSWVTLTVPGDMVRTLAESLRLDTRGKQTVTKNCRASLGHFCHPLSSVTTRGGAVT